MIKTVRKATPIQFIQLPETYNFESINRIIIFTKIVEDKSKNVVERAWRSIWKRQNILVYRENNIEPIIYNYYSEKPF